MAELTPTAAEMPVSGTSEESLPDGSPAAPSWSIASIASLACGIFLIVPFFAGAAATALGLIGIRQANESNMRGRRLAIAGLVLGLLNILGWAGYFKFIGSISGPGRTVAHHFFDDLNSADSTMAQRDCTGNVRPDQLAGAANQLKDWGGLKGITVFYITSDNSSAGEHEVTTGSVRGIVRTPGGEHIFQLHTASDDSSAWKIRDFSLQ